MEILFEDAEILVVVKPAGVCVHPSPGHATGTLTDALLVHCPKMAGVGSETRPGVVHRLDAETSGVMVFAKTQRAYVALRKAFESHTQIQKTYLAVLHGAPKEKTGTIADPIDGKRAVSHWTVLAKCGSLALVEFVIETGRTHQIRLHAKALGHPLVGDKLYGSREKDNHLRVRPTRQLLHAVTLGFPHPRTGRILTFSTPPPSDIIYI